MDYQKFLEQKLVEHQASGWIQEDVSGFLFEYQKDIVRFCLERGQSAVFLDCGLGKTAIQLEWAHRVCEHTGGRVLIVAPLCVAEQTHREADKFGIDGVKVCRSQEEVTTRITITNYEMLEKFDASQFVGVVLDESSILKSFSGKTKRTLCEMFQRTKYRLAATATPSPNDMMELLNQADWLGIMPSNEALSRWFINDTMNFGTYRIKGHAKEDFWRWVCTWAVFADTPADLGYSEESCAAFKLPDLKLHTHFIETNEAGEDGELFKDNTINATALYRHLRETLPERALFARDIIMKDDDQYIVWVNTNQEADEIMRLIPDAVEVRGSDSVQHKQQSSLDFIDGKIRVLVSKASIFGFGMNMQNCRNAVFLGLNFSYESYYQALKRIHRFGQKRDVNIYIVLSQSEYSIYKTVKDKQDMNESAKREVLNYTSRYAMLGENKRRSLKMYYERKMHKTELFEMINGDCIEEIKTIESNTIGFSVFSPPFANLYIYSDSYRDMGNCKDDDDFIQHFKFLVHEIHRILIPGRIVAVHCKNLVDYRNTSGRSGLRDFRGAIIKLFEECNFKYHSEVTIWKDPVIEMQRTKSQGLLHRQVTDTDASLSRQGLPDYLVMFRKWDEADDNSLPVYHKDGFNFYIGESGPVSTDKRSYSIEVWQRYASPVWFDISQTRVLNAKIAREDQDEKHICPLQLDVIERAIHLWSNPGDIVFSPFAGIGSEGYGAVRLGRKFIGIELKPEYYEQAIKNIQEAENYIQQPVLF